MPYCNVRMKWESSEGCNAPVSCITLPKLSLLRPIQQEEVIDGLALAVVRNHAKGATTNAAVRVLGEITSVRVERLFGALDDA